MFVEDQVIDQCMAGHRRAQHLLYEHYAPVMLGICLRYSKNHTEAEDMLQEGFIKIFMNIRNFRKEGSFEGWMKRIMVNTAINCLQKNMYFRKQEELDEHHLAAISDEEEPAPLPEVSPDKLIRFIQGMPEGYRMVLNLYVFEGYSHRAIAQLLNISESTSKSQLFKARNFIRKKLMTETELKKSGVYER
jgi:RNA polymerase sigma-70 factor (ECF subfamily)